MIVNVFPSSLSSPVKAPAETESRLFTVTTPEISAPLASKIVEASTALLNSTST
ncbi:MULTISPECIES: hypothetical protein [Bacillus]|uniref:hypothetical protein n=1 Tax=Bacillus TaxID=1386 RepID=UPI000361860A|nr:MULTISPECIES: hypothetical protein [Bacillus]